MKCIHRSADAQQFHKEAHQPFPLHQMHAFADLSLFIQCAASSTHATEAKLQAAMASLAVETLHHEIQTNEGTLGAYRKDPSANRAAVAALLIRSVQLANQAVFSKVAGDPLLRGITVGLDAVLLVQEYAFLAHVGLGRIYFLRGEQSELLTDDHSIAADMVKRGAWSEPQAAQSPYARAFNRSLGQHEFVEVDYLEAELCKGDRFLLCNPGLNEGLDANEVHQFAKKNPPEKLAEVLVKAGLTKGIRQPLCVLLVQVEALTDTPHFAIDPGEKTNVLRQVSLFQSFTHIELLKLMRISSLQHFDEGQVFMREGEPGSEMTVILNGSVDVKKEGKIISSHGKGELFGEMALLDESPRSASVVARSSVDLIAFPKTQLFALLKIELPLAVKFFWTLSQNLNYRLRATTQQLAHPVTPPAPPPRFPTTAPKN